MGLLFVFVLHTIGTWLGRCIKRTRHFHCRFVPSGHDQCTHACTVRNRVKPPWVAREVIRLKALMPEAGCRTIAEIFNRRFADRRETVGKSFVADLLRRRSADVIRLRQTLKHRIPRPLPNNRVWALDLTGKTDLSRRQQIILGVVDHGSRACLRLVALTDKRSLSIVRELIAAFRRFGLPMFIRVDNEACLTSLSMRWVLGLLGVRMQRIDPHCPWQNGRIERFFGTLKQRLDRIQILDHAQLHTRLTEFRCWYNHVRPHQHLYGRTPAEAWSGRTASIRPGIWFDAWDGMLNGFWHPP